MPPLRPAASPASTADGLALWNAPRASTLLELVRLPASLRPDVPAIFFSTDGRQAEPLSWGALWSGTLAAGARIARESDGRRGPVLLAAPTAPAFFTSFFGILAAGCLPVPVATPASLNVSRLGWYRELLAGIAADAGARLLITTERYAPTLQTCVAPDPGGMRVVSLEEQGDDAPPAWEPASPVAGDLALLQYTSGSTSHPKGVALSHANILANARLIGDAILDPSSSGLSWLPLYHDMGLIGGALAALHGRVPLLLMPATLFVKEPASWLRAAAAFRATITLAPNFGFQHTLRHVSPDQLEGASLDSLVTALNGAEPIDPATVAAFEERFAACGLRRGVVRPVYGLAEASLAVTFSDAGEFLVDEVDADTIEQTGAAVPAQPSRRTRRFVSVGRPLPTQEVCIVDERDAPIPDRRVGEVVLRGPSVMRGYYNRPAASAEMMRGGWFHTGDLGYFADGRLYITGRSRDLIIRYGRNYYPSDIEAVVGRTEGIGRGASVAFALDPPAATQVVIVAETRLRKEHELAALDRQIRERVHAAFLFGPDDVRLVPLGGIPRTTSGKVRREECRRLYAAAALPSLTRPGGGTEGRPES